MRQVYVYFFRGNTLVRTEIFSNEMEADLYLSSEKKTSSYDYYVLEVAGEKDVI
jgi:hypothetical protein